VVTSVIGIPHVVVLTRVKQEQTMEDEVERRRAISKLIGLIKSIDDKAVQDAMEIICAVLIQHEQILAELGDDC
jgi:hypothetical protein